MPIRRSFGNRVFDADETRVMGEAFQIICDLLSLNPRANDSLKVAEAIVKAAESGIRDTEGIMAAALTTLGIVQRPDDDKRPI
jgi:hypothetical protein